MNTDWKGGTATFDHDRDGTPSTFPGTYGAGNAGVSLNQAFLDVTWAKKVNDKLSLGISAVLVAQMFKAKGIGSFAGFTETFAASGGMVMPDSLSNNGNDFSFGAGFKVGLHSPISDSFSLGLSYQSKIWMNEFDDYADLFTNQGDFDIPADLKFGVTYHANQKWDFNFDFEYIWFSDVDSVGNVIQDIFACPTAGQGGMDLSRCLGGDNGAGFGWDNMAVYKVGAKYKAGEDWTWRFGYSYGKQPIPSSQMTFNILAPATIESHITAGFTLEKVKGRQFNMSFLYAPNKKVKGPQNFDPSQGVSFEMYQWEVEASYSWRF